MRNAVAVFALLILTTRGVGSLTPFFKPSASPAPAPSSDTDMEHVTVTAPFTLTGDLQGWVIIARDARMVFGLPLVGHGTATLELVSKPGPNGPTWGFFRIQVHLRKVMRAAQRR